ncbi:MAG TPA: hypothetical protein VMT03_10340 [Polyangia bacterium]|nr:hypothetical protein [Polyangia bacterium]
MQQSRLRRHAAWALVSAAYLCASPYFEQLNNPNENVRVWATRAIAVHGVLNIDAVVGEWGYVNDKAQRDHHLYSSKAPGVTFLGVPVLFAQTKLRGLFGWGSAGKRETTFWLRLFAVKLPLCAFLWAFARFVERRTGSALARDLLVVALGLGTMLYPYGGMFVGHALAAAAAFSSFICLDEAADALPRRVALAGLFAGAAVVLEYQALLVALALAIYAAVRHRRRALWFAAGALPPAVALGAYHQAAFGKPWAFPYANIENPAYVSAHTAGFHGLAVPHLQTFPTFLFSPAYGLFTFSPILLPGLVAAIWLASRGHQDRSSDRATRQEAWLVLAICAAMFLFLSGMSNWRAGWCVGPRYIAVVVPFLVLPIVQSWPAIERRWWATAGLAGLAAASAVLNVVSGAVYPHYPESLQNPVFELAFPLLAAGATPYGLGWALGLRGLASMAPLVLLVAGAFGLVAAGPDRSRRAAHAGLALAIAGLFLTGLACCRRSPRGEQARVQAFVRATWEPRVKSAARP